MAKGLRSSKVKTNKSKLRAKVFSPVEDARKERLSAKLLELASRPRTSADSDTKMVEKGKSWIRRLVRATLADFRGFQQTMKRPFQDLEWQREQRKKAKVWTISCI